MSRANRKLIAEDTLKILKQGFYINPIGKKVVFEEEQQYSESNAKVYSPKETDELINKRVLAAPFIKTKFQVINDTALNAVRLMTEQGYEEILCLNFASAKNPGGGFLNGSQAQEESIARATGLYPCLLRCEEYYLSNRKTKSCLYTDYMIYTPDVPFIKDESGKCLINFMKVSIITAPAVNANVVREREPSNVPEIETVMRRRIEKVLRISIEHNHKHLVLGAWGCGVFGNSPSDVSRYFKEVIENNFNSIFNTIVFAVYTKNEKFILPFYRDFNQG